MLFYKWTISTVYVWTHNSSSMKREHFLFFELRRLPDSRWLSHLCRTCHGVPFPFLSSPPSSSSLSQSVLSPPVLLCSSRCHAPPPHTSLSPLTTYWKMRKIILSFSCAFPLHPSSCPQSFCSSISLSRTLHLFIPLSLSLSLPGFSPFLHPGLCGTLL